MKCDYCVTATDSSGSYVQQVLVVSDVGGLLFREDMQYVCLSQCVNVCTLLTNTSVCTGMSVTPCLHMYEYVCMRSAASGGAKWASRGGKNERKKTHAMLMTHLSHTTRWRKERAHVPLQH